MKITPKQEMFCKEYLIDLNATQAAIRAGYSEKTAKDIGCQNLAKPNIQAQIQKEMNKRADVVDISAEYILNNIIEIGERCMDRCKVMVKDGKTWEQKTTWIRDAEGEIEEVGVWEFRENGALKAQELLGKHLKLFADNVIDNSQHTHYHLGEVDKDGPIGTKIRDFASRLSAGNKR